MTRASETQQPAGPALTVEDVLQIYNWKMMERLAPVSTKGKIKWLHESRECSMSVISCQQKSGCKADDNFIEPILRGLRILLMVDHLLDIKMIV